MGQDPQKERFFSIDQFRGWDRKLNIPNLARVTYFEAIQPSLTLAKFLRTMVFANHGAINKYEIRDLAQEIFLGENATENLLQLDHDKCLGYTKEVVAEVILLLKNDASAEDVCVLLGYISTARRMY